MPKAKSPKGRRPSKAATKEFTRDMVSRMDACPTAEQLNDQVIQPFIAALEDVCGARGYVMNIYGETANLVFTGDPSQAADIYGVVEEYLTIANEDVPIDDGM